MFGTVLARASLVAVLSAAGAAAEPLPLEAFAALPRLSEVSIAPNGAHLALLASDGKATWAAVRRISGTEVGPAEHVLDTPPESVLNWCRFATDQRLLCSYTRVLHRGSRALERRRLLAIDADGQHRLELLADTKLSAAQLQDTVIDWSPGPPDTVLIEAIDPAAHVNGAHSGPRASLPPPSVYALNVVTGALALYAPGHYPIRHYLSDGHGQLRIGWGVDGTQFSYYVRHANDPQWHRFAVFESFTASQVIRPVAVDPQAPDILYGIGDYQGRDAVWRLDLNHGGAPTVVIQNPDVDVDAPVFGADGRLLGAYYQTDYPHAVYVDARAAEAAAAASAAWPELFISIVDATRDESTYLLRGRSDIEGGRFMLYSKGHLTDVGREYPDVPPESLARQRPIAYPARSGAQIPGYLTRPNAAQAPLPLVVMPHGGPVARDSWAYDYLRQFLVSRGYAVLQTNYRGSDGYGRAWMYAAFQDWGGVSYEDVIDGVHWAIEQGIADPSRVAVVGWSFGGYMALLAATREADLFRCAVSVAGISDPGLLESEHDDSLYGAALRRQIGDNPERLARDTPLLHAAQVRIPVLLVHGEDDAVVPMEQSLAMAAALERTGRPHGLIRVAGGDHSLTSGPARAELLRALAEFLDPCLAVSSRTDRLAPMR